jgi:hypothetical protein
MSNPTRFQSRKTSRSRTRIQALSPCHAFSFNRGVNPFQALLLSILKGMNPEEKQKQHQIKMATEQKKAKARSQRRSQNRGN